MITGLACAGRLAQAGTRLWPRGLLRLCFGDTPGGPKECESPDAGGLLAATWRALDVGGARLGIDRQLIPTPGGCTFAPPKSKRSERTIALDPDAVQALRDHRDTQLLERDVAGRAYRITISCFAMS